MISKTTRVHQYKEYDRQYIWHPFTQMKDYEAEPSLMIERGEGVYLYDTEGKAYLDGVSSLWVNVHGHGVKEINDAIYDQIKKISHSTLLGLGNPASAIFAKKLVEITPQSLTKVFYSDSGSTACEIAIKIAYQFWKQQDNGSHSKKTKFAHINNSYHGDTLGSVSVGGIDLFHKIYKDLLFSTLSVCLPQSYRYDGSSQEWAEESLSHLKNVFEHHHEELAGIILEPLIQGASGMLLFPENYLKEVRLLCDSYDVLMIVDEVATGFGRTGTLFACEQEDLSPDIMILAKGITGGYLPLAATLTTHKIFDAFFDDYSTLKTFFHGHTYTGNPLACSAGIASLDLFQKNDILSHVRKLSKNIQAPLQNIKSLKHVGDIRQCGLMIGIELVKNKKSKDPYAWEEKIGHRICMKTREKGVIIRPLGNVLVVMPPLVISQSEMEYLLNVISWAIEMITECQ